MKRPHKAGPCKPSQKTCATGPPKYSRYFLETATDARVDSQSRLRVAAAPAFSKAMVKFSTGAGSAEIFMSTRARSLAWPGYAVPHSPVFLLMISVHLSLLGMVNSVYAPAGTVVPPMFRSTGVVKVVASLAPVRQT